MDYPSGEAIVGFFVAVGGIAIVLQRFGILKIPITRKQNNPKDGEGEKIADLEKVQLVQAEILDRHDKQFERGNKRFDGLEVDIGSINTNVGILLDRTKK